MSTQAIMWTALPNGLTQDKSHLRLSLLVSPRLTCDAATGTLAEFSDFQDWPAQVGGLTFSVEFVGASTVAATRVVEPGNPALDSPAWKALFPTSFPVRSYAFDDRSDLAVRSFPTKKVLSFLTNLYQTIAVESAQQLPSMDDYGFGRPNGEPTGIVPLNEIAIYGRSQVELEREIYDKLQERPPSGGKPLRAIPHDWGTARTDLFQVRQMHQSLSTVPVDGDGNRQKLLAQTLPDVDFHNAVAGLGSYPMLERALGLVIDLQVPVAGVPSSGSVRVHPSLPGSLVPVTAYTLDTAKGTFLPAAGTGSDVTDGMLLLSGPDQYDVVELDVDGGAEKTLDFSYNLARLAFGDANNSIDTPDSYGLPTLRSAGFSLARVDRATRLVSTFDTASSNNTDITTGSAVTLHADDVTRGYRVDVWDSMTSQWHSLNLRDGTYQMLSGPLTREFSDEGFATVATTHSADGTSTDLRLPESLFRWAGWSLCAPRPGNTIGPDCTPQAPSNPATTALKLQTSFTAQKGTLPRLRFGAQYQFRVRAVDLAGNSFDPDAALDTAYSLPAKPIAYLRYEPVAAPAVVLRHPLGPITTPGESGNRIVIRSNFDTHIAAVSERHIAPPKTSESMAETHGMLDTAAGPPDKTLYASLVNHDNSFQVDSAHPDQPLPFAGPQLSIPYLPDPFAPGAAFATLPGAPADSVFQVPFAGTWPDTKPFRLVLDEGSGAPEFHENANERVLRVKLPKAGQVTVPMSCFLTDDPTTRPSNMLSTMKIWSLIEEAVSDATTLAGLRTLALNGGHWMLTPPRLLTLVHAVQQPLLEPQFQKLDAVKTLGQTYATLTDEFPVDGKSTIKVDIQATWQDTVDDLSDNPQPVFPHGAVRAFEVPLEVADTVCVIDDSQQVTRHFSSKHEFHDTRHRNVTYTAVATTRFKEYFPDTLTANSDNITRTSQPVTISVLNSARPAAPKPLYVVPAFGWESDTEGAWQISKRRGGALRVYLDRPWYSSGEGELLAAVLLGSAAPPGTVPGYEIPDSYKGYVTQWGQDPIWSAGAPPTQATPLPEHFGNAVDVGTELTLDELSNDPSVPFTAVGHQVSYDDAHGRRLWYCDIQMDMGEAYFPFVRLALARYQPQSLDNAHLSRVVLADFMQLAPDRAASITFDPMDPTAVQLAVNGLTYTGPGTVTMSVTLEMQVPGSQDSAWLPVAGIPLTAHTFGGPDTLWTGSVVLPAARGSRPFRLVIREFESYPTDSSGGERQRLVYADILDLGGEVIGPPQPASGSALAGYWDADGSVHVNYISTDNHVHELYIAPGRDWVDNDLSALADAASPAPNTALAGYWGADGSVHVNYISADNHVHELYIAPGRSWVDNDLTALADAVAPTAGSALDGYWGSDGSQHVNFVGADNHVHELYIAPVRNWVDNDLTLLA